MLNGIPSNVVYDKGIASFNGTNSNIGNTQKYNGTYSIRVKCKINAIDPSNVRGFYDNRGTSNTGVGYVYIGINASSFTPSSGSCYVNGVITNNFTIGQNIEVIVSGISLKTGSGTFQNIIFAIYSGFNNLGGDIELFEIYDYTLTANEVKNLYEGKRNRPLVLDSARQEILNIDGRNGVIANKYSNGGTIPNIINTAVTPVRVGNVWGMNFNGSTSKLDCGNYDSLVGDKTIIMWINPNAFNSNTMLLSNDKLLVILNDTGTIGLTSDGINQPLSAVSIKKGMWNFVLITRNSIGTTNFYINGVLSGTANQASATPVAGTTNITIGSKAGASTKFIGKNAQVRIINGILSAEEASNLFSNERKNYNV